MCPDLYKMLVKSVSKEPQLQRALETEILWSSPTFLLPSYPLPPKLLLQEQHNQALRSLWQHWRWNEVQVLCQADSLSAQVDALRWLLIRYLPYQKHQFKRIPLKPVKSLSFCTNYRKQRGEGDIYEGVKKTAGNMQNISGHYLSLKE